MDNASEPIPFVGHVELIEENKEGIEALCYKDLHDLFYKEGITASQELYDALAVLLIQSKAEASQNQKDAERYRCIKNHIWKNVLPMVRIQIMHQGNYILHTKTKELDARVDELISCSVKGELNGCHN